MIKRTIKETSREYDAHGHLVSETITETTEDDYTEYVTTSSTHPNGPTRDVMPSAIMTTSESA